MISITEATESDGSALAAVMTAAFSACDAAYSLIYASCPPGTHDNLAMQFLFTPVQRADRITFKAVDNKTGKIVGFASWSIPAGRAIPAELEKSGDDDEPRKAELPAIPGMNMTLWVEKISGPPNPPSFSEEEISKTDIGLSFFFVHPDYQNRGIGSMLLKWGIEEANRHHVRLWLTSTPQAVNVYQKKGWEVVNEHEVDLGKYGGPGIYRRARMVKIPKSNP
ncbi:acyl-CoA N-acyltransferase [Xylogone sp. PMI_703]|nr:acyl-CoA N-acyltransferase [Xylogone sp. PMI_703]